MSPQTELEFRRTRGGTSQADKLQALLEARLGEWLGMTDLGEMIGAWAVHSRIADLRKRGLTIENRQEVDPVTGQRHSFYRVTLSSQDADSERRP